MMSLYTLVCPPLFLDWIKFYKSDKSRSNKSIWSKRKNKFLYVCVL